jgi:molybdate transport system substrate-binding protein
VRRPVLSGLVALAAATTLRTGCGSSSSGGADTPPSASGSDTAGTASSSSLSKNITVFAAASLTEAFTTLGKQFEAGHAGTKVTFGYGASSTLATRVTQGAPADVFASASPKNLDAVVSAKDATTSTAFARNVPQLAVPPSNPAHIATLADLAKSGVKVARCADTVPIEALAEQLLTKADLTVEPATIEADVKATLTKVELGEVDAGIVSVTDVRATAGFARP